MSPITSEGAFLPAMRNPKLVIRFPGRDNKDMAQDDEWCEVIDGNSRTKVRFHDYALTFSIPGLYNQLFGGADSETKCISPQIMAGLLKDHLHHILKNVESSSERLDHKALRVLDFGAGNGMIAEEVRLLSHSYKDGALANSTSVVGFDILPEAKKAAERDRPGVYDDYIVADVIEYVESLRREHNRSCLGTFNVLVCVSALSFGDTSAIAFKAAISLVQDGGLVLFNLKAGVLDGDDHSTQDDATICGIKDNGFSRLVQQAVAEGSLEVLTRKTYCHRFSVTGRPLYYVAVVAIKHAPLQG